MVSEMNFFISLMANFILLNTFSCSRVHFIPILKEKEKSFDKIVSEFLEKAQVKIDQGVFDKDDMKAFVYLMRQVNDLNKKHVAPPVYWYSRQGR